MLLLEAIFAIVILVVSLSVIIESLVSGLRATVFTADYSKALVLADNAMSQIMRKRIVDAAFASEGNFPSPNDQFHYQVTTEKMLSPDAAEGGLNEVQLVVSWKSGQKEQNIRVTTWLPDTSQNQNPTEK